jgi:hypothetical protein
MVAQAEFEIETTCINALMEDGLNVLTITREAANAMRRERVDICDVSYVLINGRVIRSDMLEQRGLWTVRGQTVDDVVLELEVAVESSEYDVELLRVVVVRREA